MEDINADIPLSSHAQTIGLVENCFEAALIRKVLIFAIKEVQGSNQLKETKCFGSHDLIGYQYYGESHNCLHGLGGVGAFSVYEVLTGEPRFIQTNEKL